MKILVLCVINRSRHRKGFVRGFIHSLFVSKALTRFLKDWGRLEKHFGRYGMYVILIRPPDKVIAFVGKRFTEWFKVVYGWFGAGF